MLLILFVTLVSDVNSIKNNDETIQKDQNAYWCGHGPKRKKTKWLSN